MNLRAYRFKFQLVCFMGFKVHEMSHSAKSLTETATTILNH